MQTHALHRTFAESEYGQTLEQRTRFDDFKPDWVGTELWCDLLGDDVNNLRHMPYTLDIARVFTRRLGIDLQESKKLFQTAITHDWAEAVVGDIALPDKDEHSERLEREVYRTIAREILDKEVAIDLIDTVVPILDRKGELGDMFRCIEYLGFYATHNKAYIAANSIAHGLTPVECSRHEKEQLVGGLLGLHKAVEIKDMGVLRGYVEEHPLVSRVIGEVRCLT